MTTSVTFKIDRDKLPQHTNEEFEAWIKYVIGSRGGINMENPLHDQDLDHTELYSWSD